MPGEDDVQEGVPPASTRAPQPAAAAEAPQPAVEPPSCRTKGNGSFEVCFSTPGPLGLDFGLAELDGGMIGLQVKDIAPDSPASHVAALRPGMILEMIDEFRIRASTPQQLDIMASSAMTARRPIVLTFGPPAVEEDSAGELVATFSESGSLGLDFALAQNRDMTYGMVVRGVAEGSQAASIEGLRAGLVLHSISNGSVEMRAWSPQELDAICSAAMGGRRPITLRFLAPEEAQEAAEEDVVVTFSEEQTGSLGLDFKLEMRADGKVGIGVSGIKPDSHASQADGLRPGLVLESVGGTAICAETPAELGSVMESAMTDARPVELRFSAPQPSPTFKEVDATFTEADTGPLGLDFELTSLPDGSFAMSVAGIAPGSHASRVAGLESGMLLQSISQGDVLLRESQSLLKKPRAAALTVLCGAGAVTPHELNAVVDAAMNLRRPLCLRFKGLDGADMASMEVSRCCALLPQVGSPKWSGLLSRVKDMDAEKEADLKTALRETNASLLSLESSLVQSMSESYKETSTAATRCPVDTVGGLDTELLNWLSLVDLAASAGIKVNLHAQARALRC